MEYVGSHKPSLGIADPGQLFLDLGQALIERTAPSPLEWQRQGLAKAIWLEQFTRQFAEDLIWRSAKAPKRSLQMVRILWMRRNKDVLLLRQALEGIAPGEVVSVEPSITFEQFLSHYRWQQRTYLCLAWLMEMACEPQKAKAFQACADNLFQDCGFLELMHDRSRTTKTRSD